jgi:hypothetical protein
VKIPANLDLPYSTSGRRDPKIWVMLVFGLIFAWLSFQVDPQMNCDESGNCNSWVVHIARAIGSLSAFAAVAILIGNTPRGSGIDTRTGELVWWHGRNGEAERLSIEKISRIRIDLDSESSDDIHLFDQGGDRLPFAGTPVIPWPYQDWAERLIERYPHIKLEVRR